MFHALLSKFFFHFLSLLHFSNLLGLLLFYSVPGEKERDYSGTSVNGHSLWWMSIYHVMDNSRCTNYYSPRLNTFTAHEFRTIRVHQMIFSNRNTPQITDTLGWVLVGGAQKYAGTGNASMYKTRHKMIETF